MPEHAADQQPDLLTITEAAVVLRTPVAALRYWRHRNTGPRSFRLGGPQRLTGGAERHSSRTLADCLRTASRQSHRMILLCRTNPLVSGLSCGAPSGTRTPNPLIKSQLLCQLS